MDSRLKNLIIGAFRKLSYRWSPRNQAKALAKVDSSLYRCKTCECLCYEGSSEDNYQEFLFKYENVEVKSRKGAMDHIVPVIDPVKGFQTLDILADRMFVAIDGWQYLCYDCHKEKSKLENIERKLNRKKNV